MVWSCDWNNEVVCVILIKVVETDDPSGEGVVSINLLVNSMSFPVVIGVNNSMKVIVL